MAIDLTPQRQSESAQTEPQTEPQTLAHSQQRLADAQRIAKIGSWVLVIATNQLVWSDEIFRIFELDPTRFGASYEAFLDAIHPDDREVVDTLYTTALKTKTPYDVVHRLQMPDGRIKWVHERCETTYDDEGNAIRSVGTVQDVTTRVAAEQAAALNTAAIESAHNAIAFANLAGRLTYVNPSFVSLWGYQRRDELLGRNASELWGYPSGDLAALAGTECNGGWSGEVTAWCADGSSRVLQVSAHLVCDALGRPAALMASFLDLSHRVEIERQLAAQLREKEVLLREIHHRVKNNLQIISSLLHFEARKDRVRSLPQPFTELRQRLLAMTLVHEKLYQAQNLAIVDFSDYVSSLVCALSGSFGRGPAVRFEASSDAVQLPIEQAMPAGMIVCELAVNVLKHAFPDGREGVATVSTRMSGGRVELIVADDGVGFPEGFERRDEHSFGWSSSARWSPSSKESSKSPTTAAPTSSCRSPIRTLGARSPAEPDVRHQIGSTKRVYVVEDESIVAMELKDHLRDFGFEVCGHASSGEAALREIPVARPDLVLMDINLGRGLSGIDVAQRLRGVVEVPFVYVTAYVDAELADHAAQTESFGYVVKPFQTQALRANIEMALRRHDASIRLRDSEQRFRTLFEQAAVGVAEVDSRTGRFVVRSRAPRDRPIHRANRRSHAANAAAWPQAPAVGDRSDEPVILVPSRSRMTRRIASDRIGCGDAAGETSEAKDSIRRAALQRLLWQPTEHERRPCAGCTARCACDRSSTLCTCGCGPRCPIAPSMLSRDPAQRPVHPVYFPMLYGLGSLRVFAAVWPVADYYCRFPAGESGAAIELRSEFLEYLDLLTHDIAYMSAAGLVSVGWRVSLSPHVSGIGDTTFVIEPTSSTTLADVERDLQCIGVALPARIRRLARMRLFCLRTSTTKIEELSRREGEVIDLLLSGFGTASIAQQLFISPHTVRNHLKHVCFKLGVRSQRELRELFAVR